MNVTKQKFRELEISRFFPYLTEEFTTDKAIQGQVLRIWKDFIMTLKSHGAEESIFIPTDTPQSRIFSALLSCDTRFTIIQLNEKLMISKKNSCFSLFDSQEKKQLSRSTPSCKKLLYSSEIEYFRKSDLMILSKLIQEVFISLSSETKTFRFRAIGSDRYFLIKALQLIFPNTLKSVKVNKVYWEIFFNFNRKIGLTEKSKNRVISILKILNLDFDNVIHSKSIYRPELPMIDTKNAKELAISLAQQYLTTCLHMDSEDPKILDSDNYFNLRLKEIQTHPLFLSTFQYPIEKCLVSDEHSPFKPLLNARDLKEVLIQYFLLPENQREVVQNCWDGKPIDMWFCELQTTNFLNSPELLIRSALLKKDVESNKFSFKKNPSLDDLEKTCRLQMIRSFMPSENPIPLTKVLINKKTHFMPQFIDPENRQFFYFSPIIASLYRAAFNELTLSELEINALTKKILTNSPLGIFTTEENIILNILKLASFSWYGFSDIELRTEILVDLIHFLKKGYPGIQLKYLNPQKKPLCVFEITNSTNFSVTRTSEYALIQGNETIVYFNFETATFVNNEQFSLELKFPLIHINPQIPLEEHAQILEKLLGKVKK